ncbi:hypothetical protein MA47_00830 [Corynebacterium auriscanis]|uniref:Uncharacterized protein n=1 Tax=Corynebacterium auriscanis TaxID=99807 RepID=A0A0A2DNH2_9CORY|nr:hypothetical protein MA47_00830 [Corynebacterium auriscanis]
MPSLDCASSQESQCRSRWLRTLPAQYHRQIAWPRSASARLREPPLYQNPRGPRAPLSSAPAHLPLWVPNPPPPETGLERSLRAPGEMPTKHPDPNPS